MNMITRVVRAGELPAELRGDIDPATLVRVIMQPDAEAERRTASLPLRPKAADDVELREIPKACRHPDDDMVLATALAGRTDVIVSGDADLLALHPFQGIPVLNPAAFLEWAGAAPL